MPDEPTKSLINVNLTEPATVFINRVSDAIGGLAKPWQMKRLAEAEVEVAVIRTTGESKLSDLKERALARLGNEQAQQQVAMESITAKAAPLITKEAKPNEVSQEWIRYFFDKCRHVTDDDMQALWAKVLAGTANSPGSYSKRTLAVLELLEKREAELFEKLCRYIWRFPGPPVPIITDHQKSIYVGNGISFGVMQHFDGIGLLHCDFTEGFSLNYSGIVRTVYGGKAYRVTVPQGMQLPVGNVILTTTGMELCRIVSDSPVPGFDDHVLDFWRTQGFTIEVAETN